MFNVLTNIAWLPVLLAFVPYFLLGALWFTVLFPKQYKLALGRENDSQQTVSPIFIVGPTLCCLVITVTSAVLLNALTIDSYESALLFAVLSGFGYLFANTVNIAINPNMH